jgi:hypothetical protein
MCSRPPQNVKDGWITDEIASCIDLIDPTSPPIRSAARSPGFAPGAMRSFGGDYPLAFMTSGLACLSASL